MKGRVIERVGAIVGIIGTLWLIFRTPKDIASSLSPVSGGPAGSSNPPVGPRAYILNLDGDTITMGIGDTLLAKLPIGPWIWGVKHVAATAAGTGANVPSLFTGNRPEDGMQTHPAVAQTLGDETIAWETQTGGKTFRARVVVA